MADVHVLPGVFREDLVEDGTAEIALKGALDANLRDVVIVGRGMTGEIQVYGSVSDVDRTVGLLQRGIQFLLQAPQIMEPDDEGSA